jgi:hypothetical protein
LRQALEGRLSGHHALLVSRLLAHIDYLDETIDSLSAEIEERLRPFERQLALLQTIPGVVPLTAEVMLAEFGPDMSRFPSDRYAASWAAICPGHDESAGKRRSGKTRKGVRWLRTALIEAANSAAGRTRGTYLNAQYLRLKSRRRHSKAIVAVAHSILVSAYHVLHEQRSYKDLGGDYFVRRVDTEHLTRRLVRQLERLGQSVTLRQRQGEALFLSRRWRPSGAVQQRITGGTGTLRSPIWMRTSNSTSRVAPDGKTYRGYEGVREFWGILRHVFGDFRIDTEEIINCGEMLFSRVRLRSVGKASGVRTDDVLYQTLTARESRLIRVEYFRDRGEALEAVGRRE